MGRFALSPLLVAATFSAARGDDLAGHIESARIYGSVTEFAYYYVDLLIGSPVPQRASVIVDTGSTICAFPCSGCSHCGNHLDSAFDVSKSDTAQWVKCASNNHCGRCQGGRCGYTQSYTEGSSISGSYIEDYISLGDQTEQNPPVPARFGCHDRETKLFYTQKANGIFGLSPGLSGKPSIMEDLFRDKVHINNKVFAMCLANEGGMISFGGHNASLHRSSLVWAQMSTRGAYGIALNSIVFDKSRTPVATSGFGVAIVDSGTTYSYFPTPVYRELLHAVENYCRDNEDCGGPEDRYSVCWDLGEGGTPDKFPVFEVKIQGGASMKWHPSAYMWRKTMRSTVWCLGFADNVGSYETVLGATWMIGQNLVFDLEHKRLGLAAANCPEARNRPSPPKVARSAPLPSWTMSAWAERGATDTSIPSLSSAGPGKLLGPIITPFTQSAASCFLFILGVLACVSMVRSIRTAEHRWEELSATAALRAEEEELAAAASTTAAAMSGSAGGIGGGAGAGAGGGGSSSSCRRKPTSVTSSPQKRPFEVSGRFGETVERSPPGLPMRLWLATGADDFDTETGSDGDADGPGPLSSGSDRGHLAGPPRHSSGGN